MRFIVPFFWFFSFQICADLPQTFPKELLVQWFSYSQNSLYRCTGFFISPTVVVTNAHCLEAKPGSVPKYFVKFADTTRGKPYSGKLDTIVVGTDDDLALIEVEGGDRSTPTVLNSLKGEGERIYTMGYNALGELQTIGGLSEVYYDLSLKKWTSYLNTDAPYLFASVKGMSGSPVLNTDGEVVGIIDRYDSARKRLHFSLIEHVIAMAQMQDIAVRFPPHFTKRAPPTFRDSCSSLWRTFLSGTGV